MKQAEDDRVEILVTLAGVAAETIEIIGRRIWRMSLAHRVAVE